jgi:hypothetical protein
VVTSADRGVALPHSATLTRCFELDTGVSKKTDAGAPGRAPGQPGRSGDRYGAAGASSACLPGLSRGCSAVLQRRVRRLRPRHGPTLPSATSAGRWRISSPTRTAAAPSATQPPATYYRPVPRSADGHGPLSPERSSALPAHPLIRDPGSVMAPGGPSPEPRRQACRPRLPRLTSPARALWVAR